MKFIYPAVFRKAEDGTYEGHFPDLECCYAKGDTLEDAVDNANEAAYDWKRTAASPLYRTKVIWIYRKGIL